MGNIMSDSSQNSKKTPNEKPERSIERKDNTIKSEIKKNDHSDVVPGIPSEVLDNLPPEARKKLISMSMFMSSGPIPHPLYEKLEAEHLHKIIDATEKDNERDFQDKQSSRRWNCLWLLVICVFILAVFALFIFSKNTDLVVPIGTALLGFAGGFGSGFGVGRHGRER